jgi:hypothetical protein
MLKIPYALGNEEDRSSIFSHPQGSTFIGQGSAEEVCQQSRLGGHLESPDVAGGQVEETPISKLSTREAQFGLSCCSVEGAVSVGGQGCTEYGVRK